MSVSVGSGVSATLVQPRIYGDQRPLTLGALGDLWNDTSASPVIKICTNAVGPVWTTVGGGGGSGDVVGPASSVASEVVLFDGTTGKLIKQQQALVLLKLHLVYIQ